MAMSDQAVSNVTSAIVTVLPSGVSLVQALFARQHPGEPVPTSAEVLAAFGSACASSIASHDAWLAAHPPAG